MEIARAEAQDLPPPAGADGILSAPPEDLSGLVPARLPGTRPFDPAQWLAPDAAFAAQMAERDRLVQRMPERVAAALPGSGAAVDELRAAVLAQLAAFDYRVGPGAVTRPDGVTVPLDGRPPLLTLGRLVQDDLCVMERLQGEDRLTAAILCFPAGWTLAQKIGRPLLQIHAPVALYDDDAARRVARLFDGLRPGRPLARANLHPVHDGTLFAPLREGEPKPRHGAGQRFLRSEFQVLTRLPQTGAIVFSIRTRIFPAPEPAA